MVRVPHRAFAGKVVHLVHSTPRQHAASLQPYDEVPGFADEIVVERGPVAASVVHGDALAAGCPVHGLDGFQHLVVLALEAGRARRPQLQRERHCLPAADAACRDHAAVVAVDEHVASLLRGPARVPDERDVLHRMGELLAYLGRVDQQKRVMPHEAGSVPQDGTCHGLSQHVVVEVPAQPLLRVDWPYVIVDRAHDR